MCNPSQGFYGSNNTFSPAAQAVRWVYPLSLGQVVTATVMPELSPQAQAVWDAYELVDCDAFAIDPRQAGLAAALRVVAEHCTCGDGEGDWIYRPTILAIADELEAQ